MKGYKMKRYTVKGSIYKFSTLDDAKAEAIRIGATEIIEWDVGFGK